MAHDSGPESGDIPIILAEIERAGCRKTNESKKLMEFQVPNGQTVYVVKETSHLNQINLRVHLGLEWQTLVGLPGVESVSKGYFYNSNMRKFPRQLHKGKTETQYGRQLRINTLGGLGEFLRAFKSVRF